MRPSPQNQPFRLYPGLFHLPGRRRLRRRKAIAVDSNRAVYLAGSTGSSDFPTTAGSFDPALTGAGTPLPSRCGWLPRRLTPTSRRPPGTVPCLAGCQHPISYGNAGLTLAASPVLTATLDSGLVYLSDTSGITPTVNDHTLIWSLPTCLSRLATRSPCASGCL